MPKPAMASRYQAVKLGGPFETVQTEHPGPKADEVLIRLKAIGLNPIDWKQL
jgi:NADPH:quinone reductase-like Zn-dependent oxidoreductase